MKTTCQNDFFWGASSKVDVWQIKPFTGFFLIAGKSACYIFYSVKSSDFSKLKDINKGLCLCSRFKAFEYVDKWKNSLSPGIDFIQELVPPCPCNSGLKYKKCHLSIANIISSCLFIIQKNSSLLRETSSLFHTQIN